MKKSIKWINIKGLDAELFSARFSDSDDSFMVIKIPSGISCYGIRSSLQENGFLRIGDFYIRYSDNVSLKELKKIFRDIEVIDKDASSTRILFSDTTPDIINQQKKLFKQKNVTDDGTVILNDFQAKYAPQSKTGTPIAAIPLQLSTGTRDALIDIAERRGDLDGWVCEELGYSDIESMSEVLSPEQIDAIAVAIDNAYNGSGSICADQTGLGKGRVGAGIARWAAKKGRLFVFLTEKKNLFTDFVRDLQDINTMDIIGTPFILNSDAKILDQATNEVIFQSLKNADHKKQIKKGEVPSGTKMVMATYSQLNRKDSDKSKFFTKICKNSHIHADESHNAAGEDSNTNKSVIEAMENAASFSYSSATHAKLARNMAVYSPLLPSSIRGMDNMIDVLDAGGIPLMESLSQNLAKTGRLIRREHNLGDTTIKLITDKVHKDLHEKNSDILAPILSDIASLSRDISKWLEKKNESPDAKNKKENYYSVHWGVRFSGVINQFLAASKIDMCVDYAVDCLKRDEKPVIVMQNTMEAVLRDIASDPDDPSALLSKITDENGVDRIPEFKDILILLVDRTLTARVRKGNDDPETIQLDDPALMAKAYEIKKSIEKFPMLPFSPMDEITSRIEKKGAELFAKGEIEKPWVGGEISGRGVKIGDEGVETLVQPDRNVSINNFQHGVSDFILLTNAASTGLSLHANERSEDKRVRHMFEYQIPPNPVGRIQFWGRIWRRGGINNPLFTCLATALTLELRTLAAQNRKIEKLSANVTGSRNAGIDLEVIDPINSLGNKIAKNILMENPQSARRMGISLNVDEDRAEDELYFANKILSRLGLLVSSEREAIYLPFIEDYKSALADQAARGMHPTRPRELPGSWTIMKRELFNAGDEEDGSVFGAPVYLSTIEREEYIYPINQNGMSEILDKNHTNNDGKFDLKKEEIITYFKENESSMLKDVLPGRYISVMEAYNCRDNNRVKIEAEKFNSIKLFLKKACIGGQVTITNENDEKVSGIIVDIKLPEDENNYSRPMNFFLEFVIPGDEKIRKKSLASLKGDKGFEIPQLSKDYAPTLTKYNDLPSGRTKIQRKILDGNLFAAVCSAVQHKIGSTTRINLDTGNTVSAILIPKRYDNFISTIPGSTRLINVAKEILRNGGELYLNGSVKKDGMIIDVDGDAIRLSIPGKKSLCKSYEIPEITDVTGPFVGDWRGKNAWVSPSSFEDVSNALFSKGYSYNFIGRWRELALSVSQQKEKPPESVPALTM